MPCRLFIPRAYNPKRSYPLIVFLHGGAGNGADNLKQIIEGNTNGSHVWIRDNVQREYPAFVLAPQAPDGETWGGPEAPELSPAARMMLEIVGSLRHKFNIDKSRLYLTGQSLGGFGTWDVIIRRPDIFAAAVPLCGSGIVKGFPFRTVYAPTDFKRIRDVPIWVFQGADDATVPRDGPRQTVAELRRVGNKVRYTEYPGVGHQVWEHAYEDPELVAWVFSQHRTP
jgi:predicted peptidase